MIVIKVEEMELEKALKLLEQPVAMAPVNPPDTYYVAEQVVEILEREQIPFARITDEEVVQFAERMFADTTQALEDVRRGRTVSGTLPLSIKKLTEVSRQNGSLQ